jgi:hypothetical protein
MHNGIRLIKPTSSVLVFFPKTLSFIEWQVSMEEIALVFKMKTSEF